jgi:hypothetical protein
MDAMDTEPARDPFACAVIDKIGGTAATARLCEVRLPSVSQWRVNGIPRARIQFLRLARPDVFAELAEAKGV